MSGRPTLPRSLRTLCSMTLEEQLIATLRTSFGDVSVERTPAGEVSLRFAAAHSEVGDAVAVVEGDEVTVYIGAITHGHFNRFDVDPADRNRSIANDVAAFLANVFGDRVVLWKHGTSGGWRSLGDEEKPMRLKHGATFTWSGPVA